MSFDMKKVLDISNSAKDIEEVLKNFYYRVEYPFTRAGVRARNLPLFNKELYELILNLKRLPEVRVFEDHYIEKYSTRGLNDKPLRYHANIAYKSLLLDMHFYFILKESNLFDDVRIEYIHDIAAQTDILLKKNNIELGLQLFSGDKNYELTKQKSVQSQQYQLGYKLLLYNVRDNLEWKRNLIVADGTQINLFSEKDAQYIAQFISTTNTPEISASQNEDEFALLLPAKVNVSNENHLNKNKKEVITYSYIYMGPKTEEQRVYISTLKKKGIKVFYVYFKPSSSIFTFIAKDGQEFSENGIPINKDKAHMILKKYESYLKNFNLKQYIVEHAQAKMNLAINAGAGSGKTTTLVWRILYLLFTGKVDSLKQIVMITFTNEAAGNMKVALEEQFEKIYRITGNTKHYQYLQEINAMKIVTIPSFAKDIIKQFSYYLGLSNNIEVSARIMKFREILDSVLDEELKKYTINPFGSLTYHKIIKLLEELWSKFTQKGIVASEIATYLKENQKDDQLKIIIATVLKRVDEKFNELKFDDDFLTLSDLTRFLKLLDNPRIELNELGETYKYLFVDEFQDTDIAQIQFIASITKKANLNLTVVGDTKQSVYRFRGADATAFTVLDDYLKRIDAPQMNNFNLTENFRSSRELIEEMEKIFDKWRRHSLLPSKEKQMTSKQMRKIDLKHMFNLNKNQFTTDDLMRHYNFMPKNEEKPNVLAILVRSNEEALKIGGILNNLEGAPEYEVRTEGTLYSSKAAKDLLVLLHSWIYVNGDKVAKRQAMFSLSDTAFCIKEKELKFTRNGYKNMVIGAEDLEFLLPDIWRESLLLMKEKPVLPVIEDFLSKSDFVSNLEKSNMNQFSIMKYEFNLEKITLEIFNALGQNASLLQIYDWLALQIATNKESEEVELEDTIFDENFIRVMTVHKSKGLQFHTVVLPYVNNGFLKPMEKIKKDFIVQLDKDNMPIFGWKYVDEDDAFTNETTNYESLRKEENKEQSREESRLLYVAMTRAEQSLIVYGLENTKMNVSQPNSWGELLLM